jgi:hypothetical protein
MPATILSKTQLDNVMKPNIEAGLPKSGICRKISRHIIYTPNKCLGLGIKHPFIIQGIRKLEMLFNNCQTLTAQLIETSWIRTMSECGMGVAFLENNCKNSIPILTKSWIVSLWEFVSLHKITVRRATITKPQRS